MKVSNPGLPRLRAFEALILIAFALAFVGAHAAPRNPSLVDKPAPAFVRTSLDHKNVDLAGLRGRVVLLNFWATWCAPCQTEMPRFVQWQQQYKANGLSILAISMDDDAEPVKTLIGKWNLNF